MAKMIFKGYEVKNLDNVVMLDLAKSFKPVEEVPELVAEPVYEGPSVDELKAEIDQYRRDWEAERSHLLKKAQEEADEIIKKAEQVAFDEVKRQTDQARVIAHDAEVKKEAILSEARQNAEKIIQEAQGREALVKNEAYQKGIDAGKEEGYKKGEQEAGYLIERLHKIIETAMDRRSHILAETEQQIVDLVLLMTRKVVKVISENQKSVITANIIHALRKVKTKGDITIRVNLSDIEMATKHKERFLSLVEQVKNIFVIEDTSVDPGGCIIETDFGAIDARIASQLQELEQKILEISPITVEQRSDA